MLQKSELKVKYGLVTAISMVIGIVIGSGVFFKAERVLNATNGSLGMGILAWIIGGLVMVISAYAFAIMAGEYSYVNGLVDYAENIVGKKYAALFAWFAIVIYYPCLSSVVSWVAARYFCALFGYSMSSAECLTLSSFFLIAIYVMNSLSPVIAGKFQVSTTIIKMIPLLIIAIFGTAKGLSSGLMIENFQYLGPNVDAVGSDGGLFSAVVGTVFAFEGWVIATSINAELKNPKKNLPIALIVGTLIVIFTYIFYYIGLSGVVENAILMESGEKGAKLAFNRLFGNIGGTILMVFVVISCLGTVNGLMLACCRGAFALATRGIGIAPKIMDNVDPDTNMPTNSSVIGLLVSECWLVYFYGANVQGTWFAPFIFDSSEIPLVNTYAMYIPLYLCFMKKNKKLGFFKSKLIPILATICSLFIVYACFLSHGKAMIYYLIVFVIIMLIGYFYTVYEKKK